MTTNLLRTDCYSACYDSLNQYRMRSLSFKIAFLRLPNILQALPAAETASIVLGAGSLLAPRPGPRVSCASGWQHCRAHGALLE